MVCTHENIEIDLIIIDSIVNGENYQTEENIYVCSDCGSEVDGSPVEDRADYLAECQLMELLDK